MPSHKGFQPKMGNEESSLLAWVGVSLLQEFSSCFEATYESFFLQYLINPTCLAGHTYVNIISEEPILANISGVSYLGCIVYYKYNIEGAGKGSMMQIVFILMTFYLHS